MTMILASASPRRKELLEIFAGAGNLQIVPAKGEEKPPEHVGPAETVIALAQAKACEIRDCRKLRQDEVIIAADTIVWHEGRILGKPHCEEEAFRMLKSLSGCTHEVYTGLSVITRELALKDFERTVVTFRTIDEDEIRAYIATKEPMDKAGAYGVQGMGGMFVSRIEGSPSNVIGLPMHLVREMLRNIGWKI